MRKSKEEKTDEVLKRFSLEYQIIIKVYEQNSLKKQVVNGKTLSSSLDITQKSADEMLKTLYKRNVLDEKTTKQGCQTYVIKDGGLYFAELLYKSYKDKKNESKLKPKKLKLKIKENKKDPKPPQR